MSDVVLEYLRSRKLTELSTLGVGQRKGEVLIFLPLFDFRGVDTMDTRLCP